MTQKNIDMKRVYEKPSLEIYIGDVAYLAYHG